MGTDFFYRVTQSNHRSNSQVKQSEPYCLIITCTWVILKRMTFKSKISTHGNMCAFEIVSNFLNGFVNTIFAALILNPFNAAIDLRHQNQTLSKVDPRAEKV